MEAMSTLACIASRNSNKRLTFMSTEDSTAGELDP